MMNALTVKSMAPACMVINVGRKQPSGARRAAQEPSSNCLLAQENSAALAMHGTLSSERSLYDDSIQGLYLATASQTVNKTRGGGACID